MTTIKLQTEINSSIEKCFDLSRDIDFHILSAEKTNEVAIAGKTHGLCELGDKITWEATHFGIRQRLSVEITKMDRPLFFQDEMTKGSFKKMQHQHYFEVLNGKTVMTDIFMYEVPFGFLGKIFDKIILKRYMLNFLLTRNSALKKIAEQAACNSKLSL